MLSVIIIYLFPDVTRQYKKIQITATGLHLLCIFIKFT